MTINMEEVIEFFGSQKEMARRMGISEAAVSTFVKEGWPAFRALQIEIMSDGKFKATDLIDVRV